MVKLNFSGKAFGGALLAGKVEFNFSFDTKSFELGFSAKAGAGGGEGADVFFVGNVEPSSGERAEDRLGVRVTADLDAAAGAGPAVAVGVEKTLVSLSTDKGLEVGGESRVTPQLGVGVGTAGTATINIKVEATSSAIAEIAERLGFSPEAERHEDDTR